MITIQHIQVRPESLTADASFDDRDAQGNILRSGREQFTLSQAACDALLAEASAAVSGGLASVAPVNLTALFKARDDAKAELAATGVELEAKRAEVAALAVAPTEPPAMEKAP